MEYILLYVGIVLSVMIVVVLWGKFDPEIKAQNDKYEKSLKDKSDRTMVC